MHDRYGHIVALSAKFLCLKMEFHAKVTHTYLFFGLYNDMCQTKNDKSVNYVKNSQHKVIPANLEASDETFDKETGSDVTKVYVFHPQLCAQCFSLNICFINVVLMCCRLDITQELMDYWDAGLKMEETGESTGR